MSILNDTFNQSQEQRISSFFNNASIFIGNKFIVGFWGEYVNGALVYLNSHATADPARGNIQKIYNGQNIYSVLFNKWRSTHVVPDSSDSEVDLKWACESVKIPHVGAKIRKGFNIDTIKSIDYPLIEGHDGTKTVVLSIVEDKRMMWYQFFNALQNQFFDPTILKPKSSYHKMGMYIAVLGDHYMDNTNPSTRGPYDNSTKESHHTTTNLNTTNNREVILEVMPMQVFEFNSVVMSGMSDTMLDNTTKNKTTFTVNIECPNMFHGPFKTIGNFRGISNNSSDKQFISGTDSAGINTDLSYNTREFEDRYQIGY